MISEAEFERRFSVEALVDCSTMHWQHAQHWAQHNSTVAANVRQVRAIYAAAARRASTPIVNDPAPDLEPTQESIPQRRLADHRQVQAELAKRGWPGNGKTPT